MSNPKRALRGQSKKKRKWENFKKAPFFLVRYKRRFCQIRILFESTIVNKRLYYRTVAIQVAYTIGYPERIKYTAFIFSGRVLVNRKTLLLSMPEGDKFGQQIRNLDRVVLRFLGLTANNVFGVENNNISCG